MVQVLSQELPLSEPRMAFQPIAYEASKALRGLLSADSATRAKAVESLKMFGDEKAAKYIEGLLLGASLSPDVRSDARNVLLDLSSKYREYITDMSARVRRMKALSIPVRTKTPPKGFKALRM